MTEDPSVDLPTGVFSPEGKDGQILVSRIYKEGRVVANEEIDEPEMIEVGKFKTATATIGHSSKMTINLGNFESVTLNVFCSLPTYVEEIDEAYETARKFVDMKMNEQVKSVKEWRKESRD